MTRLINSFIILFVFALTVAAAQPKMEFVGGDTYNWGKVSPKDSPLKTVMKMKNTGDEVLVITEVNATCGCTGAKLDKKELKPGETAELDITLKVSSSNKVTKTIKIYTNEPGKTKRVYYLKAHVIRPLQLSPRQYFTFNEMKIGYEKESKLKLSNNSNKAIKLSNITVEPKTALFNLHNNLTLKPGEEIELTIKVKPEVKGNYRVTVKMNTDHPDYKDFKIMGYGRVTASPIFNDK
ncbi:MAG: DUF1573 domain-containing protein [Candidatus Kapabacteria bacterium]|jgi:LEA14-like dessication related protein|nr:DUF1573 domain-containing protein [Candidatus Kapabacteria bacterium]